jgi:MFS family permease
LRVTLEDFGPAMAGLVLSSYFAGFTAGALFCDKIIERIGHIRAYAAFGGMAVAATAAMPLLIGPLSWIALRLVIGFGCAGIFVTTESWLNAKAPPEKRGRVFAVYMVGTFIALALGQLLIGWVEVASTTPFNIIVALFAVALVLVSMTRAEAPQVQAVAPLPYSQLARAAPIAVAGAALNGLIAGTFYALVPAWMQSEKIEQATIGLFMLTAVLGGLVFQVPVGRLSDHFDRRIVLAVLGAGLAGAAVALALLPPSLPIILPVAAFFGGLMSTLYPVCVAHAHDRMPADQVIAVSSQLILLSGFGSVLGPLIGANVMARFDINGVLYMIAAAGSLLALLAVGRSLLAEPPRHLERPFAILAPQAAAIAHDPQGPSEE